MSQSRYEAYKDSGVAWLGQVPAHWDASKLRWHSRIFAGATPDRTKPEYWMNGEIPWLNSGVVNNWNVTSADEFITEFGFANYSSTKLIKPNSLLIALAGQGKTKGMVAKLLFPATCNQSLGVIEVTDRYTSVDFIHFWLHSNYQNIRNLAGGDLRDGLNLVHLANIPLPLPPLAEQQAIAAFLDRECARIDALVAAQQRMIALSKEKRQALIAHVVTQGLDPAAPRKDSGVAWLGQVPAHWEVKKLSLLSSKIGSGKTPLGGAEIYVDTGVVFLRSQNVYDEGLFLTDVVYISEKIDREMQNTRVFPGDILLNVTGASLGRTCLVPVNFPSANVNQHVCIIRMNDVSHNHYVAWFLKSHITKSVFDMYQSGAAREGLNFSTIGNLSIPLPPLAEQQAIAAFLDRECARIDTLIERAEQAIVLLRERRNALIAAAVTGQIRVDGVV